MIRNVVVVVELLWAVKEKRENSVVTSRGRQQMTKRKTTKRKLGWMDEQDALSKGKRSCYRVFDPFLSFLLNISVYFFYALSRLSSLSN
jgi:hypothetical protein